MAGNLVQFRADSELLQALDSFVDALRSDGVEVGRSTAARMLVQRALSNDESRIRSAELLRQVYIGLQPTVRDVVSRLKARLEELPDEAFLEGRL